MLDCVVGIGSNLGDRLRILQLAAERLAAWGPVARSPVYEGPALGPPQPSYLNAAVRLRWGATPESLLASLLETERTFGRVRAERWGPRTLDLDILWIEGVALRASGLTIPHPGLTSRAFALVPLLDVVPGARHPDTGRPLRDWLPHVAAGELVRVASAWRPE